MAIKAVLFDLDGVLIDAKEIHYSALNEALGEYAISREEHITTYDGLSTRRKLEMLSINKGLSESRHNQIYELKQELTYEKLCQLKPISDIVKLFEYLKSNNYKIAVCSNSIRKSLEAAVKSSKLVDMIDLLVSNEDTSMPKPMPYMYWQAMERLKLVPSECLIVEDSSIGLQAAHDSGAYYHRVKSPKDLSIETIKPLLKREPSMPVWKDPNLNILIPMAGRGSRFSTVGYNMPKPLINVKGRIMIQWVVQNLALEGNHIFLAQDEHISRYSLRHLMNAIAPFSKIVPVYGVTDGAARTALLARDLIDNDKPLFIANSDQFVEWSSTKFMYAMQENDCDGGIVTFKAYGPKWSYVKKDDSGYVTEVAEKKEISNDATVGFYYWKRGSDFVKYADQMIRNDIRTNGEFYICPVFNEAILDGLKFKTYQADRMWGLGTPEDLDFFLENKR